MNLASKAIDGDNASLWQARAEVLLAQTLFARGRNQDAKRMPADAPILKRAQDTLVHVNEMRGQSEQARSLRQQFESDQITKRLKLQQSKS